MFTIKMAKKNINFTFCTIELQTERITICFALSPPARGKANENEHKNAKLQFNEMFYMTI